MNEITDYMTAAEVQKKFTLKVLFGPMFGCELHLPADDYFLIINPGMALQHSPPEQVYPGEHAATYTQNTLYLPCDMPSPNIILRLSDALVDNETENKYRIEIQSLDNSYSALLSENELFTHEHIRFAIKRSEDEWVEDIKNFNNTSTLAAQFTEQDKRQEFADKKKKTLILGSIILLVLLLTAGLLWYKKLESDRQVVTLNDTLAGAPTPLEIVRSRNNQLIYILAESYQAMEWTQEALFKMQEKNSVVPIWLSQFRKDLISQLTKAGFPILQIDFSRPQHPIISLYRELNAEEEEKFNSLVLQKIPFALDFSMLIKTKQQLLQEARQGLDRLHIYYRQIKTSAGYALVIRDALSDSALRSLQNFIIDFHQQWGEELINFSINLNENWLQNKSYLDSSNGYLFLNPHHWYFPINKEI